MDIKAIIKKNGITVLCALSILALFLPFAKLSTTVEIFGGASTQSDTVNGFAAVTDGTLGWGLIIGPALLIAMNYIRQLGKYKGLLAVAVPVICLILAIVNVMNAKNLAMDASGGDTFSAKVSIAVGIGAILYVLCSVGTVILGLILYHDFTLDKAGLERLKGNSAELLTGVQEKVAQTMESAKTSIGEMTENMERKSEIPGGKPSKGLNPKKTEEILALIEKLASMKEAGILTEEEFSEKKKQLLEEL